jgi:hypothetical protein
VLLAVRVMRQLLLQLCLVGAASVAAFAPALVAKGRFTTHIIKHRSFVGRESHARVQEVAQTRSCSSAASKIVMRMEGGVQPAGFPDPGIHHMFCSMHADTSHECVFTQRRSALHCTSYPMTAAVSEVLACRQQSVHFSQVHWLSDWQQKALLTF